MSDTELLLKSEPGSPGRGIHRRGPAADLDGRAEAAARCGELRRRRDGVGNCAPSRADAAAIVRVAPRCWPTCGDRHEGAWAGICAGDSRGNAVSCERGAAVARLGDAGDREIVIGATTVRVPPGADVATLQAVLCAVKAMS